MYSKNKGEKNTNVSIFLNGIAVSSERPKSDSHQFWDAPCFCIISNNISSFVTWIVFYFKYILKNTLLSHHIENHFCYSFPIHCGTYNTACVSCTFSAGVQIFYLRMC